MILNLIHSKPDALIFDMDGTLWDAVETYTLAWNQFFAKNNISKALKKEDLDALMGLEESAFLENVLPEFSSAKRAAVYKEVIQIQYDMIDKIGGTIYEGVVEQMPALAKKYKLFIVSNCPEHTIKHFMRFAKIENLISDSLSHGQNYRSKHENISELITKNQLKNAVYIGDTDSDLRQSKLSGIPFIFMSYGFGNSEEYEKSFDSFNEFATYFLND